MRKYYTNWKWILIFGTVIFFLITSESVSRYPDPVVIKADLFFLIVWSLILLVSTRYSYLIITGTTLQSVYILFIRRTIDINAIIEITDEATYKVAKSQFRSLYIFYKNTSGELKWIELRVTIFPEKTLGRLVKDLKTINPRIELNKYTEKLMRSAS